MRTRSIALLGFLVLAPGAVARAGGGAQRGPHKVGVTTLTFTKTAVGSGAPRPLATAIWYPAAMTLIWAAARVSPDLAWDEWRRLTLRGHTDVYPEVWEGTLSGPDAWNAPESRRPGRTWGVPGLAMQAFPVNNLHSHAQPLLAYLRLLGVEPTPRGNLAVGDAGRFRSRVFRLGHAGHGSLRARGPVVLETRHGTARGGPGVVRW